MGGAIMYTYSSQRPVEGRRESARLCAQERHTSGKVDRLISSALALVIGIIFSAGKVPQVLAATDLIVDGTTITLSGEHVFDQVRIINGGVLLVAPFNGVAGTGMLKLIAMSIVVDATSSINADGRGFRGLLNESGEGPGGGGGGVSVLDGGGGGGYGGRGGRGVFDFAEESGPFDGQGGPAYGNLDTMAIELGSAGGSAGTGDGDFGGVGAMVGEPLSSRQKPSQLPAPSPLVVRMGRSLSVIPAAVAQEAESSFMGGWSRLVAPYAHLVGMGGPPVANSPAISMMGAGVVQGGASSCSLTPSHLWAISPSLEGSAHGLPSLAKMGAFFPPNCNHNW